MPTSTVTARGTTVSVEYRYPRAGESNAGATGRATIVFTWNGNTVEKSGRFPAELVKLAGCDV